MRVVRVNTSAFEEEDFFLLTTLNNEQISEALDIFLFNQRFGKNEYDNEDLFKLLTDRFPNDKIDMFYEFDTINL